MSKYKILVIIVTYNGEKRAKQVTNGINNSNIRLDTIIIDNGSKDKTLEYYKKNLNNLVKIIKNNKNLGFGGANNIGLKYAIENNYDYVYLLNQDAWFFEDTIEKLINLCKDHSDLGIISPFQCSSNLKNIDKNFQTEVLGYESNKNIISDIYFGNTNKIYEVSWVMAAHRFIPISVIKIIGGFSPTFFHYGEDDNYINRTKYFGYKIYIAPGINVVHDRYNRKDSDSKRIRLGYVNSLNLLSNPSEKGGKKYFKIFAITIYNSCIYKSFKPIIYLFKIIIDYGKITKNKEVSINGKHPFLRNEN